MRTSDGETAMTTIRTAAALIAATLLNGSVALAVSPGACPGVCALPIGMTVAPPARPDRSDRQAASAQALPVGLTLAEDEVSLAGIAPPRRPADLLTRRIAPLAEVETEPSRAESAPPRRPAHLATAGTF